MKQNASQLAILVPLLFAGCHQPEAMKSSAKAETAKPASGSKSTVAVVELFQSQGCSSCPPANAALNAVAGRSDLIALNFSVTYWDRLGWKDTFADPAYTNRQYGYAAAFKSENVYTPQVVLNGRTAIVGNGKGELARAIKAAGKLPQGPSISADGKTVTVGKGTGSGTVWLVRYDPRTQEVAINAGENNGRKLPHRNIVRELVKLGSWQGTTKAYALPAKKDSHYNSAVLLQRGGHGPIIAARKI